MSEKNEKPIVGRCEEVNFPQLGLYGITAKVDTGAYTSSLHCYDIREKEGELLFKILEPTQNNFNVPDIRFSEFTQTNVKSSFGDIEKRYVIKTKVEIGGRTIRANFSLTNRGSMRYPVLIGRRLLNKNFLVDVSLINNLLVEDDEND